MKEKIIVFEEIPGYSRFLLRGFNLAGYKVYFLRLNRGCKNSNWVKTYTEKEIIIWLGERYQLLNVAVGYHPDLAYANIEKFCDSVINNDPVVLRIIGVYRDRRIVNVFKKQIFGYLARFYYLNYIFQKLNNDFSGEKIYFIPNLHKEGYGTFVFGPWEYRILRRFIIQANSACYLEKNIIFPFWFGLFCGLRFLFKYLATALIIIGMIPVLFGALMANLFNLRKSVRKDFKFAVMIIYPKQQISDSVRNVKFLIDEDSIKRNDLLFMCSFWLRGEQKRFLRDKGIYFKDNLFSELSFRTFRKVAAYILFLLKYLPSYVRKWFIIEAAQIQIACFSIWSDFSKHYHIGNLISYCDYGIQSIVRNILLSGSGTVTWYYSDSNNWMNCFITPDNKHYFPSQSHMLSFAVYDHFVTWSNDLINYFKLHSLSVKEYHNVGCLWASHVKEIESGRLKSTLLQNLKANRFKPGYKIISAFDSTYLDYTMTTIEDGISFIQGILHLLEDLKETYVLFKLKKTPGFMKKYTPELIKLIKEIAHPRCFFVPAYVSPSEAIAFSDLTISFPFTSTTFEALSARKKALYFDASDKFRGALFDNIPGLVCHNYEELRKRAEELLFATDNGRYREYLDNFVQGKLESYLDGQALDRFRKLLNNPV